MTPKLARIARVLAPVALLVVGGVAFGQGKPPAKAEEGTTDATSQDVAPVQREKLPSAALQDLADRLMARERALDRRESDLGSREVDLKTAESRVQQRIDELKALREELEQKMGEADEEVAERVTGVVKMFEAMRAKDSGAVMTELDEVEAVRVLDRMNRTKAGKTLAAMSPVKAASLAQHMTSPIVLDSP